MRLRIALSATLLALLTAWATVAPAMARRRHPAKPPTAAQMRAAVKRAERSRDVWATVNICDTKHHPNVIGVRGQMPALGFPATLEMTVRLRYWSGKRFDPIPRVAVKLSLGAWSRGVHQDGATFKFKPPVILSGSVSFRWRVHGKVLGRTTRLTAHGVKGVDQADPRGYSTSTCTMS